MKNKRVVKKEYLNEYGLFRSTKSNNFLGKVQAFMLFCGVNARIITGSICFLFSISLIIIRTIFVDFFAEIFSISILDTILLSFLVACFLFFAINLVERILVFTKNSENFYEEEIDEGKTKVTLSENYVLNGYIINDFNNEKYIMSERINTYLNLNNLEINFFNKVKPLVKEAREIVPFVTKKPLRSPIKFFNSRLIGMDTDILLYTSTIDTYKTNSFSNFSTNEICAKVIKSKLNLNQKLSGREFFTKDGVLLGLKNSLAANAIAVSTLAITKDNYIIALKEGKRSFLNDEKIFPTGKTFVKPNDYKQGISFNELLKSSMERALKEQLNIRQDVVISTQIIGYARILENGGRPDFFGISYIDYPYEGKNDSDINCIKYMLKNSMGILNGGIKEAIAKKLKFNKYEISKSETILDILDDRKSELRFSLQMHILSKIIKQYAEKGRNVYLELYYKCFQKRKVKMWTKRGISLDPESVNEEAVNFNNNAYWLLDGERSLDNEKIDGLTSSAFLVQRFNEEMLIKTTKEVFFLNDGIIEILKKIKSEFLKKGNGMELPSMSGAIVAEVGNCALIRFYGDCEVIVETTVGNKTKVVSIANSELERLNMHVKEMQIEEARRLNIPVVQAFESERVKKLIKENRTLRNTVYGYSGLALDKIDGCDAIEFSYKKENLKNILILSNGFASYYKEHKLCKSPQKFMKLFKKYGAKRLYYKMYKVKIKDIDCNICPRFKTVEDASSLLISFDNHKSIQKIK